MQNSNGSKNYSCICDPPSPSPSPGSSLPCTSCLLAGSIACLPFFFPRSVHPSPSSSVAAMDPPPSLSSFLPSHFSPQHPHHLHHAHSLPIPQNSSHSPSLPSHHSVSRRSVAASWLQKMVGPLNLPSEPSEEDLRASLSDGNVLCSLINKLNPEIFENEDAGHSSLPSRDNLEKFFTAVGEMRLPTYESSDLEQQNYPSSSSERVVDCLLSLKSYCEWKQGRDPGLWKYDGTLSSFNSTRSPSRDTLASPSIAAVKYNGRLASSTQKSPHQPRKRWVIPEYDNVGEADMPISDCPTTLTQQHVGSPQHLDSMHRSNGWNANVADENYVPSPVQPGTGLTSTHIQHISQKFREILRLNTKGAMQDVTAFENSAVLSSLENSSCQSLSSLVNVILGDKQQDEVPALVEFMLKKVMEEFERRLVSQSEQVVKLKCTLKEHLAREDRLALRAKILETLAAGTGEEVKIVSNQLQKMKMEKKQAEEDKKAREVLMEKLLKEKEDQQTRVESFKKELDMVKQMDQEHFQQLKLQKQELEQEMQAKLNNLEVILEESKRRVQELEASSAAEMQSLVRRDHQYQCFILSQLQAFQDIKLVLQGTKQELRHMQHAWEEEMGDLELHLQGLAQAASGYHKVLAENRQLFNEVQDLKGNIRVYCRVRPFLPGQDAKQSSVEFIGENGDVLISNPAKQGKDRHKTFCFNKVFDTSATQEEVFVDTRPLIRSVLDGYNVCIFAYGQTGSGKTYTMSGPSSTSQQDWGVNYRALNDLFQISQSRKDVFKYEVSVQMVEIYNEQVRDLLFVDGPNRRLGIRNSSQLNGLNVPDASMLPVNSTSDVFEVMKIGQKNRAVGATALNERSSRSHSVLTVHVQGTDLASGSILRGCLHLVDLAGSERVDRSEATGDRLKEAQHINKSLSALGDVVSALSQKSSHVPYRNSKLTQLLQDSLGGHAKTLMFVHISPDVESYGETVSTLKFAERVASVELGAARSNKESKELRDLKEQIAILKDVVAKKDGEIDRLQMARVSSNENTGGLEKLNARLASRNTFHKPMIEVQQKKIRRQTVDVGVNKEMRMTGRLYQDAQSVDSETASPPVSPRELKKIEVRAGKAAVVDLKNMERNITSEKKSAGIDADIRQVNRIGKHESALEPETVQKEWQDRMQSSTESSLYGTASLDDLPLSWEGIYTGKTDPHCSTLDSVTTASHPGSMTLKDRSLQAMKLNESVMQDSSEVQSETVSDAAEVDMSRNLQMAGAQQNRFHIETDRLPSTELDIASEPSDGDISQAETESSLLTIAEQKAYIRKGNHKSQSIALGQRKLLQPQIPRPFRGEWKSVNSGQTRAQTRRHSTAASPALGIEHSSSKRQPSLGAKLAVEEGISSSMPDGGLSIIGQGALKASKRWL